LAVLSAIIVFFELWRMIVMRTPALQAFGGDIYLRTDTVIG
jgi:hypothetical protein